MGKSCGNCKYRGKTYKPNKIFQEPLGCINRDSPWYYHETPIYFSCHYWEKNS